MGQTVTLNPNLTVLMPLFRERCACIRKMVRNCHEAVSAELIQRLRSNVLAPLIKTNQGAGPRRARTDCFAERHNRPHRSGMAYYHHLSRAS